jgi:hypothetical protein
VDLVEGVSRWRGHRHHHGSFGFSCRQGVLSGSG